MTLDQPLCFPTYLPESAWKVNSRKSAYSIVHGTPPQNRKGRSLAHQHSMRGSRILLCWIDIRDHECHTGTVVSDRITHVFCLAPSLSAKRRRASPTHRVHALGGGREPIEG